MLLLDCGNTRLKWCLFEEGGMREHGAALIDDLNVPQVLRIFESMSFRSVLVASVKLSPRLELLLDSLRSFDDVSVRVLEHRDLQGSQFAYEQVERLGIDRCLVILAVRNLQGGGLILDSGSAITADIVLPDGRHIGGYIFPGYRLLKESLIGGTSKIHVGALLKQSMEPGVDTESCVLNGAQLMVAQMVSYLEGVVGDYGISKIYITGGDAEAIAQAVGGEYELRADLVFEGMLMLAKQVFNQEVL